MYPMRSHLSRFLKKGWTTKYLSLLFDMSISDEHHAPKVEWAGAGTGTEKKFTKWGQVVGERKMIMKIEAKRHSFLTRSILIVIL